MTQAFGWIVALLLGLLGVTQWQYHSQKEKAEDAREEADARGKQMDVHKAALEAMESTRDSQEEITSRADVAVKSVKVIYDEEGKTDEEKDAEMDKLAAELVQETHDRARTHLLDTAQ